MKKTIFTICALLAAGAACIAGCSDGQPKDTNPEDKEPTRISVEENDEKGGNECPDGDCHGDGQHVKPNFRFVTSAEENKDEKTPEKAKRNFGKKRRFDKRFKEVKPEEKDTPAPEVEKDTNN